MFLFLLVLKFDLSAAFGTWGKIGTVVNVLSLGTDIVTTTLRLLSNVEKKIVLSIANLEGVTWEGL